MRLKQHHFKGVWGRDSKGGMLCTNKQMNEQQRKIVKKIAANIGTTIYKMVKSGNFQNCSLPLEIFKKAQQLFYADLTYKSLGIIFLSPHYSSIDSTRDSRQMLFRDSSMLFYLVFQRITQVSAYRSLSILFQGKHCKVGSEAAPSICSKSATTLQSAPTSSREGGIRYTAASIPKYLWG